MSVDVSCKLKHVAQCYIILKCCAGQCTVLVHIRKHNRMYQNKILTDTVCHIMVMFALRNQYNTV